MSPPDNQFFPHLMGLRPAMEMMLTGDAISGDEAVTYGFANRAFPVDALETEVLKVAERIARVPTDLQQMNKRAVHRRESGPLFDPALKFRRLHSIPNLLAHISRSSLLG